MADTLFYRFQGEQIEWLIFDDLGNVKNEDCQSGDVFQHENTDFIGRCVFVAPSESVLLTSANVPSRQYRQIVQAVPYVIEDNLAMDVEHCFFALGERNESGDISVAVVERPVLEGWIEATSQFGLVASAFVSEASLVATKSGLRVVIDGNRAHLGGQNNFALTQPRNELPLVVSLLEAPSEISIEVPSAQQDEIGLQVSELAANEMTVDVQPYSESAFFRLCRSYDGSQINLLQAEYKVEEKRSGRQIVWRSVAVLAGCAFLLHLLMLVGQGWYLERKANEYETASHALYKATFPQDKNVRDLRRRWNSRLGKTDGEDNVFLGLFAQSSKNIVGSGLELENVNYNESRGDLILQVSGERSEDLVRYTQQLTERGLTAEIGTISQAGDQVKGSIKINSQGKAS